MLPSVLAGACVLATKDYATDLSGSAASREWSRIQRERTHAKKQST